MYNDVTRTKTTANVIKRRRKHMNPEIIIMLTNNDITVTNAEEVFESCKDLPAKSGVLKTLVFQRKK